MLWLINTFNKSSSYLVQVFTITPSVLPSSVYSVYGVYKPENGGNDHFPAQLRGQNHSTLCVPFCFLNPTKSKILDPPLNKCAYGDVYEIPVLTISSISRS